MFWIICAGLAMVVALAIAAPVMRRRGPEAEPAAAYDLRVYRDQLREVERDLERRVIAPAEAERLRNEIGRKVLGADRALATETTARRAPGGLAAVAVLVVLLGGAFALYAHLGAPQLPDEPMSARLSQAQLRYDTRPTQAEAEAAAPASDRAPPTPQIAALVARARTAAAQDPDQPLRQQALSLLEEELGNFVAAKEAQARFIAVNGTNNTAADYARLTRLTIMAAGGNITRDAEAGIAHALTLDPTQPEARFFAGLLQAQTGRPDRAFPIWATLLDEGHADQPWIGFVRGSMGELAWFAGQPDYALPELPPTPHAPNLPGPDADAVAAAGDLTPQARQEMIAGMVSGLESRLATEGGTPDEWARLISSLVVLGQNARARAILAEARTHFGAAPDALQIIDMAAKKAGLE